MLNQLDGDEDGVPGGNFEVTAALDTSLTYKDLNGDLVSLSLTRGGVLVRPRDSR